LAPRSAQARNNYGAILLRLKRAREAAAEFEASLSLDPHQASALVNLAQIRFAGGTPENLHVAAELFRRADALTPDAAIARALVVIALKRGDRAQAAENYRAYATRSKGVSGGVNDGASAAAHVELGGALSEAGLLAEAEAELKAALALDPANAEAVGHLARVYLARKDFPSAGRTLEAAVARGITVAPIYALLAEVYEKSGHLENAIPAMRLAIQSDPQSEKYRFRYAVLLANADAPAAAVIRLNEALQTFPKSARLWLALGMSNFNLGKTDEAIRAFNRAVELDPDLAQAYAYQGMARVALGQSDEAITFYERALQRDPQLFVIHYLIADTLLKQTEADAARIETHLKQAIQADKTYVPARLALGKLYARTERQAEAIAELEQVIALDPDLAEAHYHLGRTYSRLKRAAEAQVSLATFKRLSESQKQQQQDEQRDIVRRLADVRF
ncbi:MAG: tetratricopeptide repeat protein, partial [Acidobacteriota bacterium]|nr:tetratricopeptide repeat protein [Acidobacteriota bacterium]